MLFRKSVPQFLSHYSTLNLFRSSAKRSFTSACLHCLPRRGLPYNYLPNASKSNWNRRLGKRSDNRRRDWLLPDVENFFCVDFHAIYTTMAQQGNNWLWFRSSSHSVYKILIDWNVTELQKKCISFKYTLELSYLRVDWPIKLEICIFKMKHYSLR